MGFQTPMIELEKVSGADQQWNDPVARFSTWIQVGRREGPTTTHYGVAGAPYGRRHALGNRK